MNYDKDYCINIFSRNTLLDRNVRKKQKTFFLTEEYKFEKKVIRSSISEFLYVNKILQYRPVDEVLKMYIKNMMPLKEIMCKRMFIMVFVANSTNNACFRNMYSLDVIKKLRKETGILSLDDVDFRLVIDKDNIDGNIMYDKMASLYSRFITLREKEVVYKLSRDCTIEVSKNGQLFISM